ncbi:MAG TPA: SPFH/Band 7/PHB domain protein [Natronincola sp.]|nr:SPFH/Band 7/PHB domain protein [Natronincola sp.]
MGVALFLFMLVLVLLVTVAITGTKLVGQSEVIVIERLGKYHRTAESGLNIIIPILDKPKYIQERLMTKDVDGKIIVRERVTNRIDLREQVQDFPHQSVITMDNVSMNIDAVLYYQVMDPVRATYEIANLPYALETLTKTTLRSVIGEMDLDETLASREEINNKLRTMLDQATDKWGIHVTRVEILDIIPPATIREAMENQMRAERKRRARVLEAQGDKEARILEAQGKRDAEINVAEGMAKSRLMIAEAEAKSIETVQSALKTGNASSYLVATKYLEALPQMADGKATKIFLPVETASILGTVGAFAEMLELDKKK